MAIEIIEEEIESKHEVKSFGIFRIDIDVKKGTVRRKSIKFDYPYELELYQQLQKEGIEPCHKSRHIIENNGKRYVIENGSVIRIDVPKKRFLQKIKPRRLLE